MDYRRLTRVQRRAPEGALFDYRQLDAPSPAAKALIAGAVAAYVANYVVSLRAALSVGLATTVYVYHDQAGRALPGGQRRIPRVRDPPDPYSRR